MESRAIWLRTICRSNNLDVDNVKIEMLEKFAASLLDWNKKINLVSRKDEEKFWENHILHSVSILFKLQFPESSRVLDLGTGGGLPGIPLRILLPDIRLTLLDSIQKKVNAVEQIVRGLSLNSVSTVWGRAEEIGKQKEHHEQYDIIVARGVAPLKNLVRWSIPFFKKGERKTVQRGEELKTEIEKMMVTSPALITLKGGDLQKEINAAKRILGVQSIKLIDLTLKGTEQFQVADKKIVLVSF